MLMQSEGCIMENFFEMHMEKAQVNAISNTGLAHIGENYLA